MRDEFGAKNPKSLMLRFHTQTAGVQLTAQQPEVNLVRVAVQALAAVLGGTQSLHTNSFDEAIALPTEQGGPLALRTQQVLAYETDVTEDRRPVRRLLRRGAMTDEVERRPRELMAAVEERGGAVAAIEQGFQKAEIEKSAYTVRSRSSSGERVCRRRQPVPWRRPRSSTSRCGSTRRSRRSSASGWLRCARVAGQRRGRPSGSTSCAGRRDRDRQRALSDARGVAGAGDRRRGVARPARGVGDLHTGGRLLDVARGKGRLDRAIETVSHHLDRFEMVELAVLATMRVPRRSALIPKLERFLGFSLVPRRVVVLTNRRLLLPRGYAEGDDWVDVSLDRRQVRVLKEQKFGRMASLDLTTALGRQVITTTSADDAARLKKALGGL